MACSMSLISNISGVSGCENNIREYIISQIKDKADNIEIDSMGNIIAFKSGRSSTRKILLGTNIDESGFIVSGITDKGYIKFKKVGNIDTRSIISKRVLINDTVKGVIGIKAVHLQKKSERESVPEISSLYIDIGHKKKETAEKIVQPGDYISFDTKFEHLGDNIKGKALTRMGIVSVISAMKAVPEFDTYFVFSTQSEIPCSVPGRGMRIASHRIQPDFALIVNTITAADTYKSDNHNKISEIGGGAVIEYMDRTCISDMKFTSALNDFANANNMPVQNVTVSAQNSIAGAVQTSSKGTVTAVIGIPCRYKNTPVNIMSKKDIETVTDLCTEFIKESGVIINGIA